MLLVIGSNGFVGRSVARYFRAQRRMVCTASHQPGADLRLDMGGHCAILEGLAAFPITDALVCSGMTDVDRCAREAQPTWQFNVERTREVVRMLRGHGIGVIYCSSDMVFAGDCGPYREIDLPHPSTAYGRQKVAVEADLRAHSGRSAIVRMSKLYSLDEDDGSMIHRTLRALRSDCAGRFATDQIVVPTCVDDVARTVAAIVDRKLEGVFHVAPQVRYTRFDLALALGVQLGLPERVAACSIDDIVVVEPRPKQLWLDGSTSAARTGVRPIELADVLKRIVTSFQAGAVAA